LVSVNTRAPEGSSKPKRVDFCFDEAVTYPMDDDGFDGNDFTLAGYDSRSEVEGDDNPDPVVDLAIPGHKCVVVTFPDDTDIKRYTVGTVSEGAVMGQDSNKLNLVNAQPNGTSIEQVGGGLSVAPDITQVTTDVTYNQLVYKFDRNVEEDSVQWWNFFYYDPSGNKVYAIAAEVDDADKTIVRVQFDPEDGDESVTDAVRAGIEVGAVESESPDREDAIRQTVAVVGQDGFTARPDLVQAKLVPADSNAVDYTFDQPVRIFDVNAFELFREIGGDPIYQGQFAQVLVSNPKTVRVWFDLAVGDITGQLVVASVDDFCFFFCGGAAVQATNGNLFNGVQSLPLGGVRNVKGFTSAPDATSVAFDTDEGSATILFDQPIDADQGPENDIHVVDRFGNTFDVAQQNIVVVDGNRLKLEIPAGTAQQAVGVTIDEDTIDGTQPNGNTGGFTGKDPNVDQAIGRANQPVSPGPGPLVPTPAPGTNGGGGATAGAGAAAASQAVSPASVQVSPAKSGKASKSKGRVVFARMIRTKSGKYVLVMKVSSKAKTAKIRIRLVSKSGKVVRSTVRTVKTNKTVRLQGLVAAKGAKLRISLA
jgi:hypothetical protein